MKESSLLKSADGTEWSSEDRSCPVCGSRAAKRFGARGGRAHHDARGLETNIVQCDECALIYTHPTLMPVTNPYDKESDEYFQLHDEQQKNQSGRRFRGLCWACWAALVACWMGCGCGELLRGAMN